jgi:hypothetical protein
VSREVSLFSVREKRQESKFEEFRSLLEFEKFVSFES